MNRKSFRCVLSIWIMFGLFVACQDGDDNEVGSDTESDTGCCAASRMAQNQRSGCTEFDANIHPPPSDISFVTEAEGLSPRGRSAAKEMRSILTSPSAEVFCPLEGGGSIVNLGATYRVSGCATQHLYESMTDNCESMLCISMTNLLGEWKPE